MQTLMFTVKKQFTVINMSGMNREELFVSVVKMIMVRIIIEWLV